VNRWNCCGAYLSHGAREARRRDNPGGKVDITYTKKKVRINNNLIYAHLISTPDSPESILGLHAVVRRRGDGTCWSRWVAWDIDCHGPGDDPGRNLRYALELCDRLRVLGFDPLLLDSNGRGGYHVWVVFAEPIPSSDAYWFARWLVRDWREQGFTSMPEAYPKQASLTAGGEGSFGSWLRAPGGAHHSREHRCMIYREGSWLGGTEMREHLVATRLATPDLIPAGVHEFAAECDRRVQRGGSNFTPASDSPALVSDPDRNIRWAESAAMSLTAEYPADRQLWRGVACSLKGFGEPGFAIFDRFSKQCPAKYSPEATRRLWDGINPDGGITLGSLIHWARECN
jgi:hypothetical protein